MVLCAYPLSPKSFFQGYGNNGLSQYVYMSAYHCQNCEQKMTARTSVHSDYYCEHFYLINFRSIYVIFVTPRHRNTFCAWGHQLPATALCLPAQFMIFSLQPQAILMLSPARKYYARVNLCHMPP